MYLKDSPYVSNVYYQSFLPLPYLTLLIVSNE